MGSFVVLYGDEKNLVPKAKELASGQHIAHTIVTVYDDAAGPEAYHLAKGADVTVLLYSKRTIKASYGFAPGQLSEADIEHVVSDLSKILPAPKAPSGDK